MTQSTATETATIEPFGPYTADDIAAFYDSGDWQDRVLYQLVAEKAAERGDQVFVTDGDVSLTYAEMYERGIRLAAGLQRLGVGHGDRVAVQLPNWAEFTEIVIALSRLGAILLPIMPIFRHDEVGFSLADSGAKVLIGPDLWHRFSHRELYLDLLAQIPTLEHVVIVRPEAGSDLGAAHSLDDLGAGSGSPADAMPLGELDASLGDGVGPNEGFVIVYTSGTTSRPKGCYHTFNTYYAGSKALVDRLHVTEDDVFFNPSPVSHTTGLVTGFLVPLLVGGATHFMATWDPATGMDRIRDHGCTMTVTSTTFLATVMQAYRPGEHDMSSMKYWICAGSPIPGSIVQGARTMFGGLSVLSLYGRSENLTTALCAPEDAPEKSVMSDGRALPGAEIKVVDPTSGLELPRGEEGDVTYRGPSHMVSYFHNDIATAELYTPDRFSRSGDLGYMDADGFVRITGRTKDIIIRGGINIGSREVEDLLITHESVRDVAVVAMPDPRLGERACAFIVVEPGHEPLSLASMQEFLRTKKIAVQKMPERIEAIDGLPMTPTGKVQKQLLRERIAATIADERAKA
ncbi:AMP-binding protein [Frondihabitans australicus]|uniref:Cyclohexanecarboxylate-CoA ligase n=1 Tax=Frondihabitans australicus TaxID=386892 RepID=A0A495IGU3_9MICO|nr:AMP-binding protein [Frondihabitans australicus]RKR74375.1 cyclohexanecarboxylate-CoA ligase [Frondihabitans australicus]